MPLPPVEVHVLEDPDGELADLFARELSVAPELRSSARRRALDDLPGYVIVATTLAPFFHALMEQLGVEAATHVGRVLDRLRQPPRLQPKQCAAREVRLVDPRQRVTLVFDEAAAADSRAVRAMFDVEFKLLRPRTVLRWDRDRGGWRGER
jgi:hypothetical protein